MRMNNEYVRKWKGLFAKCWMKMKEKILFKTKLKTSFLIKIIMK